MELLCSEVQVVLWSLMKVVWGSRSSPFTSTLDRSDAVLKRLPQDQLREYLSCRVMTRARLATEPSGSNVHVFFKRYRSLTRYH